VTREPQPEVPDLGGADAGDRSSITDVNGSIARFEMAYTPGERERFSFGPTLLQRAPSFVALAAALALVVLVAMAHFGSSNSNLYIWIVERDRGVPTVPLTFIIALCAVSFVVATSLRGVIVTRDAVEARYVGGFGVPRVRKWSWAQIDRLIVADDDVMLELWNGAYEKLPRVREGTQLADLLGRIAASRGRTVTRLAAKL
jgi:hypothetical protein